jgi:hypothetical protein
MLRHILVSYGIVFIRIRFAAVTAQSSYLNQIVESVLMS